ncbi:MAG: SDR family NAD(P)-dependent oxidoreductase [Sandaracinaceae bacterium]
MNHHKPHKAVAIVGVGAILPDARDAAQFWDNLRTGKYSVGDIPDDRWDPGLYYDEDPKAPDKAYSRIGGFVRDYDWQPMKWHLPIPPRVGDAMDRSQKWAIAAVRQALEDYGPRELNRERTAVILGNAMGGDKHYLTAARIMFPEFADALRQAPSFSSLPDDLRRAVIEEMHRDVEQRFPIINEDTMPGELANIIAGRVASIFDLHGPNYVTDAACASAMAAMNAAMEGLEEYDYDVVLTGGVDANMSASSYIKFCKIGALSATGTRPFDAGADGFVMGEGAAVFMLKRLEDAEKDGDRIYAVIRGFGGSSDGRGKGITAPNPIGQRLAIERAWHNAGVSPATATMVEAHGTSTRVGDVVEVSTLNEVFGSFDLPMGSVALGSVKSNIGHLKGAAGAAGILKAALSLHHREIPESLGFASPNPKVDWSATPLAVSTEHHAWERTVDGVRRAGVSAFGFGGTNFHAVLEEYVPGRIAGEKKTTVAVGDVPFHSRSVTATPGGMAPLRGALVLGAQSREGLAERVKRAMADASRGQAPPLAAPESADLRAPVRVAIDYEDGAMLATKCGRVLKALGSNHAGMWKALRAQGIFLGEGAAPKVAFLFPGQGSQYVNMLAELRAREPVVQRTFAEADQVMTPLLGKPLTELVFVDGQDPAAMSAAGKRLQQTAVTQPAMLAADVAFSRLLGAYGITPDMVMGHSLGEYAAMVAAGVIDFGHALKAVSARGTEMTKVSVADNGAMVAVFGDVEEIQAILKEAEGYLVLANINSRSQVVVGGATEAVHRVTATFQKAGLRAIPLPVSHAFHTEIVAPASEPLKRVLQTLDLSPPTLPVISNVTGDFHPMGPGSVPAIIDLLGRQIAAPVQFVKGLHTLYDAGARVFVECGPKRALHGMTDDVLGAHDDVLALFTNHPKVGEVASFNQTLAGLWASGFGLGDAPTAPTPSVDTPSPAPAAVRAPAGPASYEQLGRILAEVLERAGTGVPVGAGSTRPDTTVVVSGASLGLPGAEHVFDEENVGRILGGDTLIDVLSLKARKSILDKHITRLVKSDAGARFERIEKMDEVIKLAGQAGAFDLAGEFGVPAERVPALDRATQLAMAAGIEALRDAGIPLVMKYKTTTKNTLLPERWMLPEHLRDDTGVIFGSAFPGYDALARDLEGYFEDRARRARLEDLESLMRWLPAETPPSVRRELDHRVEQLRAEVERHAYVFDRFFIFKVLAMGHSQFAEYLGARGPNTHVNAACASGTQAIALASDWIREGRCRRVVCITADDVTGSGLIEWIGAGFLASGAAATDGVVEEAALPFDRRRHGLILGMGASGVLVESEDSVRERAIRPICEVLGTAVANSAFHGSRLDVSHIGAVMEGLVRDVEARHGLDRHRMAKEMVFVSHETYTPARGGSAQAEVNALRHVFGASADAIVIANTKGFTGHAMGAGIEDAVAVKMLETGVVPPVANFKEIDPDLGSLNLSRGGTYPIRYALRLGAGFGSQLSLSLLRWVPSTDGARPAAHALGYRGRLEDGARYAAWLERVSGVDDPELEVVGKTLRVRDTGRAGTRAPTREAAAPAPKPVAAAPVANAPTPAPTPEPAATPNAAVRERVLSIVAAQTGYPPEMLDTDLDLEADLGIDTVKQAETFAAVREAYGIARDENLQLREFPTLEHVIGWVLSKRSQAAASEAAPDEAAPTAVDATMRRRVPVAVVRPDLELCETSAVTLEAGRRVIVASDEAGVAEALASVLEARGVEVLRLDPSSDLDARLDQLAEGPIHGVFWLPALDAAPPLSELDHGSWRASLGRRVKALYRTMRRLYDEIAEADRFLVAGTRLGGRHGYDAAGASCPLGGAVTGFTKTYARERPEALVKAVDFAASMVPDEVAQRLVDEALRDPGTVEVGYADGRRFGVGLSERPVADEPTTAYGPDSVFVVTGAAGSIVAAITADLATGGGTFYLLDLAPAPAADDPDVALFRRDRDALMRALAERIAQTGERATPVKVQKAMAGVERRAAARDAIEAIEAAGGTAHYRQVDLTDADAVAAIMDEVRESHDRLDVLVHAAGLEISRFLSEKTPEEFELVFDVKADGCFHLLRAAAELPIGALVVFSSIAGRFGNAGQADYAAANDLLCKLVTSFRNTRPATRGIAVDWTAWAGIGMAARGSIPQMMARAGIDMLPAVEGVPVVRRELERGTDGEIVVAGSLGVLLAPRHASGGARPGALEAPGPLCARLSEITPTGAVAFESTLSPEAQPFLHDHAIDGTPILPGVMGIEGLRGDRTRRWWGRLARRRDRSGRLPGALQVLP